MCEQLMGNIQSFISTKLKKYKYQLLLAVSDRFVDNVSFFFDEDWKSGSRVGWTGYETGSGTLPIFFKEKYFLQTPS